MTKPTTPRIQQRNKTNAGIPASQALLQPNQLPEALLPLRALVAARPRQRAARIPAVPEPALHAGLGADDAALDGGPVAPRDDLLQLQRLGHLAVVVQAHELDARLGRDVGQAGEDAVAAAHEALEGEVGAAA